MNRKHHATARIDDPASQREWQAQEAALRHERLHLNPEHDDPRTLGYRLLARALKTEPPGALPDDFAPRVAALTAQAAQAKRASATSLETILIIALASALLLSAAAAAAKYGASWWPAFAAWLPAPAIAQWLVALVGCVGLTWLVGAGSRLMTGSSNAG